MNKIWSSTTIQRSDLTKTVWDIDTEFNDMTRIVNTIGYQDAARKGW